MDERLRPAFAEQPCAESAGISRGHSGAVTDFELRLTVDGNGLGYTGQLQSYAGLYEGELTASDFFVKTPRSRPRRPTTCATSKPIARASAR